MKFKVQMGGSTVLLTPEQLDRVAAVLEDSTLFYEKYVGNNKGYYGSDNCYMIEYLPFVASKHFRADIMTDMEVDKWHTLQKMREADVTKGDAV